MNRMITFVIFLFFVLLLILTKNSIESFCVSPRVTTWTPYIIDWMRQPGYSNYYYNNGYMYPIY